MKRWLAFLAGVWLCGVTCMATCAHEQSAPSTGSTVDETSYDAASFGAELKRLSGILRKKPSTNEMAALRDALPRRWKVSTPPGNYRVSSEPLRNQLTALQSGKAQAWVDLLAQEVLGYLSLQDTTAQAQARKELDRILARPEYAAVRPPNAWERFRERMALWIGELLLRLFGGVLGRPITGQIVFWVLVIVGVGCIGLWLFRFLVSRDRMEALQPSGSVIASCTWQEWIRLAREAANRGDFREAVHSAYWAGVVRLEDAGVLPRDRTKTPREYLRLVSEPASGASTLAPATHHREPMAALTSRLEHTWYANRGTTAEDFRESVKQLERLGCQLE